LQPPSCHKSERERERERDREREKERERKRRQEDFIIYKHKRIKKKLIMVYNIIVECVLGKRGGGGGGRI